MKRAWLAFALLGLMVGSSGCGGLVHRLCKGPLIGSCQTCPEDCATCDPGCRARGCPDCAAAGPPAGTITYPYYTTRGPRDFLARSPQPLGPY